MDARELTVGGTYVYLGENETVFFEPFRKISKVSPLFNGAKLIFKGRNTSVLAWVFRYPEADKDVLLPSALIDQLRPVE